MLHPLPLLVQTRCQLPGLRCCSSWAAPVPAIGRSAFAMASFGTAFGAGAQQPTANPNKDMEVPSTPSDSISSLKFSPTSNLLVASSWSGQVLCWDVQATGQAIPKAAITLDKPVLCSAWSADGTTVFAGAQRPGWPAQTAHEVRRVWVGAR